VASQLGELAAGGIVKAVHVSGGEPFLFQDDLRFLGLAIAGRQLAFGINTNAFWATSLTAARAVVDDITGLTQLFLSTDVYHEEFIPIARVVNAAKAGVLSGLHVYIGICTPRGEEAEIVRRVRQQLGAEYLEKVYVGATPVETGGRASGLIEARWRRRSSAVPLGACRLIKRPVVMPNGDVLACCNTTAHSRCGSSPLVLGSVECERLSDILARGRRNKILEVIGTFGPAALAAVLPREAFNMLSGEYLEDDVCGLCVDMMSNSRIVSVLEDPEVFRKIERLSQAAAALGLDGNSRKDSGGITVGW
jgi:hypothetical protein